MSKANLGRNNGATAAINQMSKTESYFSISKK